MLKALFGALALLLWIGGAQASTYKISFYQDGLGDAGPDWFGTLNVGEFVPDYNDAYYLDLFGTVSMVAQTSAFSASINGITYDLDPYDWPKQFSAFYGLDGLYTNGAPTMEPPFAAGLLLAAYWWTAADNVCGGDDSIPVSGGCVWGLDAPHGTFAISAVPLPPTLLLLGSALGLLMVSVGRRKRL